MTPGRLVAVRTVYRRHFLVFDLIVSLGLASVIAYYFHSSGWSLLGALDLAGRRALYASIATISASLLGFVLVAVPIVFALPPTQRLELLRKSKQYPTIFRTFMSSLTYFALTTIYVTVLLVIDTSVSPHPVYGYVLVWLTVIAALRFVRAVQILGRLLDIASKRDPTDP
jgi:hypothetical protein